MSTRNNQVSTQVAKPKHGPWVRASHTVDNIIVIIILAWVLTCLMAGLLSTIAGINPAQWVQDFATPTVIWLMRLSFIIALLFFVTLIVSVIVGHSANVERTRSSYR